MAGIPVKILNLTDRPTDEVRKLLHFGMRGLNHKGLVVKVVTSRKKAWDGKIHCSGYADGRGSILIRLAPDSQFPFQGWRRHRSSPWAHDWTDWREALVALAAHEVRHYNLPWITGWRGKSQQRIEMACEAFENLRLREYRATLSEEGTT